MVIYYEEDGNMDIQDAREQRGLMIAATTKLRRKGGLWIVPSQAGHGTYTVNLKAEMPTCSCPDFETRQCKCKHVWAVEFTVKREVRSDGSSQTTKTVRLTYSQDWAAYNMAQTHEKERVLELLDRLCDGIVQSPQRKRGRPRLPPSDMVFVAVMKIYGTMSSRRSSSDFREYAMKGYIGNVPHYNSVSNYLEDEALTPVLNTLVAQTAKPLAALESYFAADSSGFSTCAYERWFDAKYGKMKSQHEWLKAHLMTGVLTNVVTQVEVTKGTQNDAPMLPTLVAGTAKHFKMAEVSADKGYISKNNLAVIAEAGATPYIPFKSNVNINTVVEGPVLWQKMYCHYVLHREKFLAHYHKRSNVESTFWMIKSKFGERLRSKTFTAQVNEVLCKVICHNLCVLVQSIYESGIEPDFWAEISHAQESTPKV